MGAIRIIPESEFRTTAWSGGTTTELFIFPDGASYAERRFSARISSATVDIDESVFTALPGVKRFLTPLCAGFELSVNGSAVSLPFGEVLEFSGEDAVVCRGRGRDLNLMLKGPEGEMRIVSGAFEVSEGAMGFIFALETLAVSYCAEPLRCTSALLTEYAFASAAPGEYRADGAAVLFEIFPAERC